MLSPTKSKCKRIVLLTRRSIIIWLQSLVSIPGYIPLPATLYIGHSHYESWRTGIPVFEPRARGENQINFLKNLGDLLEYFHLLKRRRQTGPQPQAVNTLSFYTNPVWGIQPALATYVANDAAPFVFFSNFRTGLHVVIFIQWSAWFMRITSEIFLCLKLKIHGLDLHKQPIYHYIQVSPKNNIKLIWFGS